MPRQTANGKGEKADGKLRPRGVGINLHPHAVRELFELGLEEKLDAIGLRTGEMACCSQRGGLIWPEPRGLEAGCNWPRYSVHRGELQGLLCHELPERCRPEVITTGAALAGWNAGEHGVVAHLVNRRSGATR